MLPGIFADAVILQNISIPFDVAPADAFALESGTTARRDDRSSRLSSDGVVGVAVVIAFYLR
jgi:hypothetical protein